MFKSKKSFATIELPKLLAPNWQYCIPLITIIVLVWHYAALAQTSPSGENIGDLRVALDTLWVLVASVLVIFMNAGFAMLETGFCRRKNAVNLLSKNLIVFAVSTLSFWAIGFALMFSDGNSLIGNQGFFLLGADNSPATGGGYQGVYSAISWTGVPLAAKFLFEVAFAGTAATIVSGAVAERIKFIDYLIFSSLLVIIIYPMVGHWIWGGGWLAELGFKDFAGSTVVHSVGGWCGLIGALILGPRLGKYGRDGKIVMPLLGHNLSIATLGCFILWIGWFGFNPGSTMTVNANISHIALVTNLSAAAAGLSAVVTSWCLAGKPDLSLIINGILSGLVAITASCAFVGTFSAVIIGLVAGILVVFAVYFFDSVRIDDPVGALSVHLVNGIWGTLAVGLFANAQIGGDGQSSGGLMTTGSFTLLGVQILGIIAVGIATTTLSFILWQILKSIFGLRVSPEEEFTGLDISEHGMEAYSGFVTIDTDNSPE
jgi:Amt family ammonium transporter